MKKPCLTCGAPAAGSRCEPCDATHRAAVDRRATERRRANATDRRRAYGGRAYRAAARAIRDSGAPCWICGQPARPGDPLTADHLVPVAAGGADGPLAPAHRSCNVGRGNALRTAARARSGHATDRATAGAPVPACLPAGPLGARIVDPLQPSGRGGGAQPGAGRNLPQHPTGDPGLARGRARTGSGPLSGPALGGPGAGGRR